MLVALSYRDTDFGGKRNNYNLPVNDEDLDRQEIPNKLKTIMKSQSNLNSNEQKRKKKNKKKNFKKAAGICSFFLFFFFYSAH